MFYDYHMHSNFSNDSKTDMEDMIKRSIDLGLREICFTDHVDYDLDTDFDWGIDYDKYFEKLDFLQNKYKDKISIKKGIELGLQKQITDKCSEDAHKYPFDFIICSIHAINKSDLYLGEFFKGKTQHEAYEAYFNELYTVVKKYKDYSILGHLDLIKRYGNYDNLLKDSLFSDIIEEILKQAIYDGKGIELNTSCYRYNLPDLTPSRQILNMYKDLGGEIITTGSDSHNPSQVAYQFDYIYSYLKNSGFKYVCKFNKMKPEFIKI
ncbi:histidinol-phosphatase HisJ family protein [Romboutsia sedimentorum]|uniref:Histidinol-phosphatase n=1 Tax=Romboutsia sedimentorum TaxID=1368474 RepID=A0ABT7E7H3_9FIRM|nr:histidinol-phosphatase HisJ family protein [Romboutsia sedimentorum]MDK2562879.1 histidinol-phosphatase HisJ family protein [Romboutsia sedimentorum]MDK2585638.1 histidinol-phosphatase HisJ family protein [Romboutsia sedimentorum]